jgi:serine/threonine-protein kinase
MAAAPIHLAPTMNAPRTTDTVCVGAASPAPSITLGHDAAARQEAAAAQVRFRRSLTAGYAIWASFTLVDWEVVRHLDGGSFAYFAALRAWIIVFVAVPILLWLYTKRAASPRAMTALDVCAFGSAAVVISLMCLEFRGLASPYVPGLCLVLAARTVMAQDPWPRGVALSGVPVLGFYAVLLGAALFMPRIAEQLHDPAAVTTLAVSSAYVAGSYVLSVLGGHVVWSLRRQVFEARSLGRYRLKRRIASGGMGDVWAAYHPGLKRDVAVKLLRVEAQSRDAVVRFEREVRATAALVHPNTIRVFDCGTTDDGLLYYVMELLEGDNLAAHVERNGPMPAARAVHVIGQAARALAEAHDRGIVHRDVKPENLFLTSLGGEHDFVKVLDFGVAKMKTTESAETTRAGFVLGTPAYISPEVAAGRAADARSDVYGLGGVLYFLLCGRAPFEKETLAAVFVAHVTEAPQAPSLRLGQPLPRDVEAVVLRALAKDPGERYASAADFAMALASCDLAGKWTYGAAAVARLSSRPPPASTDAPPESGPPVSLAAPPLPSFPLDSEVTPVASRLERSRARSHRA